MLYYRFYAYLPNSKMDQHIGGTRADGIINALKYADEILKADHNQQLLNVINSKHVHEDSRYCIDVLVTTRPKSKSASPLPILPQIS